MQPDFGAPARLPSALVQPEIAASPPAITVSITDSTQCHSENAKAAAAPTPAGRAAGRAAAPTTPGAAATVQSDEDGNGSEEDEEHFDENSNASEHDTCDEDDSDGDDVYEAGEIMDSRNGDGGFEYLVKWKGAGHQYNSWEPKDHIIDADLIAEFDAKRARADARGSGRGGARGGGARGGGRGGGRRGGSRGGGDACGQRGGRRGRGGGGGGGGGGKGAAGPTWRPLSADLPEPPAYKGPSELPTLVGPFANLADASKPEDFYKPFEPKAGIEARVTNSNLYHSHRHLQTGKKVYPKSDDVDYKDMHL